MPTVEFLFPCGVGGKKSLDNVMYRRRSLIKQGVLQLFGNYYSVYINFFLSFI